ncbi:hypothetical protein [Haloferula sp. A504]|uniref:hypothetical protein n=1 Tax=Haloferula sp. A504 TaxID=3373601 RepID=UPI0031C8F28F|nr:hypothetical protein [Verrucomicrobiaceae bacterium E54]
MYSLSEIAELLGRDRAALLGWVKRFDLPGFQGRGYPECYLSFLRSIAYLRLAQVTEKQIHELWTVELKLMALLHADSLGSPTWMIDGHDHPGHEERRLFLSRFDLGADVSAAAVQPGLDFSESEVELFGGQEMGEDALRLQASYRELVGPLRSKLSEQAPILTAAGRWAKGAEADNS